MKKSFFYTLLIGIVSLICYGVYGEITFTPLRKKDFECLFPNNTNAEVIFHKDFIGWSHGDYFELFIYRITNAIIGPNYPIIDSNWEYAVLPDTVETIAWSNCPIDSITQLKYEFELAWIIDSGIKEGKVLQSELKNENNYYSCIYVNGLQKYFLLYNPLTSTLYYIRQNGF